MRGTSSFCLRFYLVALGLFELKFVQSHHMAEALEEQVSQEILHRDETIEGLQRELDGLTAEKKLRDEMAEALRLAKKDLDELKAKAESLEKALDGSKAAECVALERAQKTAKVADNLHREIDAEKASRKVLKEQLDEAKTLGVATTEAYTAALAGFGGVTSSLLADASVSGLFGWLSANFAKLPTFVGKVADFAALSSANNFGRALAENGCD